MGFPGNEGARASMRYFIGLFAVAIWLTAGACKDSEFHACVEDILDKNDPIAKQRGDRFEGKVKEATARCRGGDKAVGSRSLPWLDWPNYYGTADKSSRSTSDLANLHGVGGALLDIERERVELIKFNLFDNHGTYREYVLGRQGVEGPALRTWPEMRLPPGHPNFADVGGTAEQVCSGSLIRFRTLTGICNDISQSAHGIDRDTAGPQRRIRGDVSRRRAEHDHTQSPRRANVVDDSGSAGRSVAGCSRGCSPMRPRAPTAQGGPTSPRKGTATTRKRRSSTSSRHSGSSS